MTDLDELWETQCPRGAKFRAVPDQCAELSRLFVELSWRTQEDSPGAALSRAGELLLAAAGIQHVDINVVKFDEESGFCANGWLEEKGDALSKSVTGLTRILFIYGALECVLKALGEPRSKGCRGKIRGATEYLQREFEGRQDLPPHYLCVVRELRFFSKVATIQGDEFLETSGFELDNCRGISGLGLAAAYDLRNSLAHGDIELPEQLPVARMDPNEAFTILVSRAFLLSIQMLTIAGLSAGQLGVSLPDDDWNYVGPSASAAVADIETTMLHLHCDKRATT